MTYTLGIPAANNNPSADQPKMQDNFTAINNLIDIDHVTFGATFQGEHKQITFDSNHIPAGLPTNPTSILYTAPGTASSVSQMFYKNQNGAFQVSPIKAWAYVDQAGNIINSQSLNISTIVRVSTGKYNVTLATNAVNSNSFAVLVSSYMTSNNLGSLSGYNITGVGTFQLVFLKLDASGFDNPTNFSFQVMQL